MANYICRRFVHIGLVYHQGEGSNVETRENDPNYVPSQRSTSADNINTLEPTSAFSVPHWNFRPCRLAHVSHTWTRGSTSANTPESASKVQAQHHFRGDEPTQANLEDKTVITNCKVQLSRTRDSLRERNETLQKDMETLRQQMEELRTAQQQATDAPQIASIGDPFFDEIIKEPMPPSFKPPQLTQYDGTQDLIEHVRSYKLAMMIYGASDALLCRVFPSTLKKAAQTWYFKLKAKSINSFEQLERCFIDHFTASKVPKKTNHHLMSIRQKTNESLRAYIARFHNESLQVDNLDEGMAMHALMNGLKDCDFLHSLNREKPKSLKDILHRSEGYIRAEERVVAKKGGESFEPNSVVAGDKKRRFDRSNDIADVRGGKRGVGRNLKNYRSTLQEAPRLRSNGNKRDKTRHCAFHGTHGHDTEDCKQLRMEIERLICRGALRQFVGHPGSQRGARRMERSQDNREAGRHKEKEPLDVVGVINVITVPPSATPTSMALAVKGSNESPPSTQTITFTGKDLDQREVFPHDPLMIEIVVEDRNLRKGKVMKRVLVDTGSCRDVMCYGAFKKLGVSPQLMRPCDFPLVGLSRKSVHVRGIISLPIHVGVSPCVVVVTLDFFVIDVPSSFNAILGRPGLNSLEKTLTVDSLDMREELKECRTEPIDQVKPVVLDEKRPERTVNIGVDMDPSFVAQLENCFREHKDIFAWCPADMPGIDPKVACHRLGVNQDAVPVRQKVRHFGAERTVAIEEEVAKLKEAGFIQEITFSEWLSNVVMVKKANGKWRMCVDFTDLNKVCPKDNYPLPNIDELVDNSSGYVVLSLCDAYSGYNQIPMAKEDRDKTAFIAAGATYCYVVMPFDLKNVGATYQSKSLDQHIEDLKQVFEVLKTHNMKLNPTKCTFGVKVGKFLGFMLTSRGIEVNPEKIRAVLEMKPSSSTKEVQKLMGKVVALSRAIPGEKLYLYIAASTEAISTALVREDGSKQEPVYYVSKVLQGAETRYKPLEKLAYAKPDLAGRLVRWSIELTEFKLEFQPRRAMKAQVLEDFIAELSKEEKAVMQAPPIDVPCKRKAPEPKKPTKNLPSNLVWNLYVDGSSNAAGSGAGIILISLEGETFNCTLRFNFEASNNRAEYEALLGGLRLAKAARVEYLRIYSDSQLIVNQVNGDFIATEQVMAQYLSLTMQFLQSFQGYELSQVRRSENLKADALEKLASTGLGVSGVEVYIETLSSPSIEMENALPTQEEQSWIDPILTFLKRPVEAQVVLEEVHEGLCSSHMAADSLARKILRQGYFWPTLKADAKAYPFAQWGMDILGPFPEAKGRKKFLIVAIDYFTKWIEAEPVARITEQKVKKFVKKHIMCRFGMLRVLVTNNGTQFASEAFKDFYQTGKIERRFSVRAQLETEGLSLQQIEQRFASVAYPESNGQAEAANKAILESLKKKVRFAKGTWTEELPYTLWAYRTTHKTSTGETPFNLTYGSKAVVPVEVKVPNYRTNYFNANSNEQALRENLDLLDEARDLSQIHVAHYHRRVEKYYNSKVSPRTYTKETRSYERQRSQSAILVKGSYTLIGKDHI
ncbi:hypothetical protein SLEP1_g36923 [Rubroshorea leprosula]|uniref:Uncharacterized protein n=1 Tax=Rubroshorea leprosula TaxID=152421 RepID=A0AAV5KT80_9ROSI|nr:hypothetical protein SLEP1_g36923 [Rubroshorea leprosula]